MRRCTRPTLCLSPPHQASLVGRIAQADPSRARGIEFASPRELSFYVRGLTLGPPDALGWLIGARFSGKLAGEELSGHWGSHVTAPVARPDCLPSVRAHPVLHSPLITLSPDGRSVGHTATARTWGMAVCNVALPPHLRPAPVAASAAATAAAATGARPRGSGGSGGGHPRLSAALSTSSGGGGGRSSNGGGGGSGSGSGGDAPSSSSGLLFRRRLGGTPGDASVAPPVVAEIPRFRPGARTVGGFAASSYDFPLVPPPPADPAAGPLSRPLQVAEMAVDFGAALGMSPAEAQVSTDEECCAACPLHAFPSPPLLRQAALMMQQQFERRQAARSASGGGPAPAQAASFVLPRLPRTATPEPGSTAEGGGSGEFEADIDDEGLDGPLGQTIRGPGGLRMGGLLGSLSMATPAPPAAAPSSRDGPYTTPPDQVVSGTPALQRTGSGSPALSAAAGLAAAVAEQHRRVVGLALQQQQSNGDAAARASQVRPW